MISVWLKIRSVQFFRLLKSVGIGLLIIFIPLALVTLFGIFDRLLKSDPMYLAAIIPGIITSLHFYRRDGRFLKLTFSKKDVRKIICLEYLFISFFLCLIFGFSLRTGQFVPMALVLSAIVSFIPFSKKNDYKSYSFLPLDFLPPEAYEWRWVFRKIGIWMILIWVVGFLGLKFTGAPVLSLLLFSIFFSSAFEFLENKEILAATDIGSGFLIKKIITHLKILHILFLPHHLIFLIFHLQYWYIWLAANAAVGLLFAFNIFKKYSNWQPRRKRIYNSTQVAVFILFATVPFLMPAAVIWIIYFYRKAKGNLDYYFKV